MRSVGNIALVAALFYSLSWVYHRFFERKRWWDYGIWALFLFVLVGGLRLLLNMNLHYDMSRVPYMREGLVPFTWAVIITNLGIFYLNLVYEMLKSRRGREAQQLRLVNERQAAQLQFLRMQMNPHFLFNTLHNIYSLAVMQSEKTAPLVLRLSELLQYVIYETQAPTVSLRAEVNMLREYIELFQLQFEHPRDIRLQVNDWGAHDFQVEPLLLVPIVENCYKHCDFNDNPEAFIELVLQVDGEGLHFRATNTFNPNNRSKDRTTGVGLANIQRRLELRYPGRHQLRIKEWERTFVIDLRLASEAVDAALENN